MEFTAGVLTPRRPGRPNTKDPNGCGADFNKNSPNLRGCTEINANISMLTC